MAMVNRIAVVGMGAVYPGAKDIEKYWEMLLLGKDQIKQITEDYWIKDDYYDANLDAKDKTYSYVAGLVDSIPFNSLEFGISPKDMEVTSVEQLFALIVAKQALIDAKMYGKDSRSFDKDRVGVIIAASMGKTAFSLNTRLQAPIIRKVLKKANVSQECIEQIVDKICNTCVEWTEVSNPGYLANVVAGRIANRFDFCGTNYSVDAACGSSLAALRCSVNELLCGNCDTVLTGGVNLECSEFSFVSFCKTPAISKTNQIKPFDKNADGMVLGDGVGMLVLKRLEDAEKAGDRIYGVIRGVGASGDGKGGSIFAPQKDGQIKALKDAYRKAEITPATISLIEAHGTGTAKGDECEVEALSTYFSEYDIKKHSIALGSVKSQIGHTRIAAGMASMIKVLLSLHHKVLPPTIHVKQVNDILLDSQFQVVTEARPWIVNDYQPIRRAGVSAFGFGGTNFHVVLEEYGNEHREPYRLNHIPQYIIVRGADKEQLYNRCNELIEEMEKCSCDKERYFCISNLEKMNDDGAHKLGITYRNINELVEKMAFSLKMLKESDAARWEKNEICYYSDDSFKNDKIVTLFSGQGGQYVDMFKEMSINYPEMRSMFSIVDNAMLRDSESTVSDCVYPMNTTKEGKSEAESKLAVTKYTQAALAAVCGGLYKVLTKRGYCCDEFIGHSYGELACLWASGVFSDEAFAKLSVVRGRLMHEETEDNVGMMAVFESSKIVLEKIKIYHKLYIANINSAEQTIVSGDNDQLDLFAQALAKENITTKRLKVSSAFHSPYMNEASKKFGAEIDACEVRKGLEKPVYANATGVQYPAEEKKIKEVLKRQITSPVYFEKCVKSAYKNGARIFVEVGPGQVLSNLIRKILKEEEYELVTINPSKTEDSLLSFEFACMKLEMLGIKLKRDTYACELGEGIVLEQTKSTVMVPPTYFQTNQRQKEIDKIMEEDFKCGDNVQLSVCDEIEILQEECEEKKIEHTNIQMEGEGMRNRENYGLLNATVELQEINQKALKTFYESQNLQLNVANELFSNINRTDSGKQSIEKLIGKFQDNSLEALRLYLEEQKHELSRGVEVISYQDETHLNDLDTKDDYQIVSEQEMEEQKQLAPTQKVDSVVKPDAVVAEGDNIATIAGLLKVIVSELTGYPEDIIDEDMDIETELGIDSIKRVQILSKLSNRIEENKEFDNMDELNEAKTIKQIAEAVAGLKSALEVEDTTVEEAKDDVADTGNSKVEICKLLVNIISTITGFPEEILEYSMDLESELGIDSIKKVQVFSELSKSLGGSVDQNSVDELTSCKTIEEIADVLSKKKTLAD